MKGNIKVTPKDSSDVKKMKALNKISPNEIRIEDDIEHFIVIAAFRYCLGRRSYAPSIMVSFLQKNWSKLSESDKHLIQKETKEAIDGGYAGSEYCDVPDWQKVMAL